MFILFFFINLIFFILLTKFFYFLFKEKYIFPFRLAELYGFVVTIFLFSLISLFYFDFYITINTFFINCSFFFCIYSISNMINTSPRTKIIFLIFKKKKLNYKNLIKLYNSKKILDNRIMRLKTNNQIFLKGKKIFLTEKKVTFLRFVIFIFGLIRKI